ncbi:uncharacterized protein LOC115758849 [Drosophila novamexicana]|uniref:uncharacterized protein LOC115758849 n=1 Tax=Drosophila novamexicana TaxID=47314 RepID=UPI0011E5B82B|nr:uncharacterized protein LOC115758849 [Drosophila novamexicana]XP_030555505.1 uncharacterized protein LOC115758849 [Drosophila novamexicana]
MNGNRKFKSLRLVRFGDVLYDQQKRLIMLCRSCQRHYLSMEAFQTHLSKCIAVKHIVTSIDELQYDEEKRETRLVNGKQELLIYEPDAVRSINSVNCDIDWEAELEDPRWYTDDTRTLPNKAKQSPTNAKENVAKSRTRSLTTKDLEKEKQPHPQSPESPAKRMRHSTPKRTILTNQQQHKLRASLEMPAVTAKIKNEMYVVQNIVDDLRRLDAMRNARPANAAATATTTTSPTAASPPMVSIPMPVANTANGDTQQILNKLRACGVEVKRRNTREAMDSSSEADAKKQLALDIMRKLQSNGIKCTKVNNAKQ